MAVMLKGSCRCGAVSFRCESNTPQPYQRCYCTICRKTAGGGGYAINLMAINATMTIDDPDRVIAVYRAEIEDDEGMCTTSSGERNFCSRCATALWLWDPSWPDLIHPFASTIDTPLPRPAATVHLMLDFKPDWIVPQLSPNDESYARYPELSIEDWHKQHGVWVD